MKVAFWFYALDAEKYLSRKRLLPKYGSSILTLPLVKLFNDILHSTDYPEIWNVSLISTINEPGHEKMCLMPYPNNKGADQPAHPRSLISTFVVRCLDSIISLDSIAETSRF